MIVTDTTSQESFDGIDMWLREVSKHGGEKMPVVIIGTKSDLKNKRQVKKESAQKWVQGREGFLGYYELSAKERTGYFDVFSDIVKHFS